MKEQRIACGQFRAVPRDVNANTELIEGQIREASRRGASIIVFPEMGTSGYLPPEELPALAEPVSGPTISRIAAACRSNGVAAVVGFPELDEGTGSRHNSFAFLSSDGSLIGVYRKIHLWDTEAQWAEPGNSMPVFEYADARYTGWICFDTRFPELGRLAFLDNVDVCFVPTAWLGPASEWELSLRARALESSCFVAGSDIVNELPGLECRGHSMIIGPYGEILARAEPMKTQVIDAVLDPHAMEQQRARLRIGRSRRPSLYRRLAE